jgi:hypothetical protein
MIIIMGIVVFIYLYAIASRCGILPKDTNYKIMLSDRLYKLTKNGLTELGRIQNPDWNMMNDPYELILNKMQKELYFYGAEYDQKTKHKIRGIYKINLYGFIMNPILAWRTPFPVDILSISPNDNYLLFITYDTNSDQYQNQLNTMLLLNLETRKQQIIVDDYNGLSNAIWLNDHQFIYVSTKLRGTDKGYNLVLAVADSDTVPYVTSYDQIEKFSEQPDKRKLPVLMKTRNEFFVYGIRDGLWHHTQLKSVSAKLQSLPFSKEPLIINCNDPELIEELKVGHTTKKRILFLYDINTKTKTDLHLDGYYLGTLSPDDRRLLLADNKKTILYNIYDGSTEVIADKKMQIEKAIWLPDGKGFLYSDEMVGELLDCCVILCDGHYGLYYYSLEKKKSVRLSQFYDLTSGGGFVVLKDIDIKLPNTELNRKIWSGELKNQHLIKICNLW